jgi:hypothetical protein
VAVFLEQAGVEISTASKLGEVGRSCQVQIAACHRKYCEQGNLADSSQIILVDTAVKEFLFYFFFST